MFDVVKSKLVDLLKVAFPEQNVKVTIDKVPYGIWLWEENSHCHVHVKAQEITKILGEDAKILVSNLPEFKAHWVDLRNKPN